MAEDPGSRPMAAGPVPEPKALSLSIIEVGRFAAHPAVYARIRI
jgi:hypothetical protein